MLKMKLLGILKFFISLVFILLFNSNLTSQTEQDSLITKNKYGIRIENLVYVKKTNNNLLFHNLTLAPIEKDLINFDLLTSNEKDYLFKYHLEVYSKISKYLNPNERKWLASFI